MVPGDDGHSFVGDVYILQSGEIVGVVEAIKFLQWPRVMLNRFFSPPEPSAAPRGLPSSKVKDLPQIPTPAPNYTHDLVLATKAAVRNGDEGPGLSTGAPSLSGSSQSSPTPHFPDSPESAVGMDITTRALDLVAQELAVDVGLLTDVAEITDFGLDSLMSLVLAARLREELGIEIRDAFFLEIETIGDLKKMLR